MIHKKLLQVTFGNIYEKSDGYKIRGELIQRLFLRHFYVDTFQIVDKKYSDLDNCLIAKGRTAKILALLFSPLLVIKQIADSDLVLIEGSMFICFGFVAKLLRKRVIFDPQGAIAALGKRERNNIYNVVARLMIGNLLDFVTSNISDMSIFVSNEDLDYFMRNYGIPKERARLVRMIIDLPDPCNKITKTKNQLVFIGDLGSIQNFTAVEYLIENIAPHLKDYRFVIIGKGKDRFKQYSDNIEYTGFVEDPRNLICSCSLAVVPLISGTGVKTKVLYFLGLGIPVITTKIGAEGLINSEGIIDNGLFVSDLTNFSESIIKALDISELLNPDDLRNYVMLNHSMNSMKMDIEVILPDIIG